MSDKKSSQLALRVSTFLASFVLMGIVSITVLFPALIVRSFGGLPDYSNIDIFETGQWTIYWIFANALLAIFAILYKKNMLPSIFAKLISFVLNFEVSKRMAIIVIVITVGLYVALSFHEIYEDEPYEDYRRNAKDTIESWRPSDITSGFTYHAKLFLHFTSMIIFGNYKVGVLLASTSILVLVYCITKEITQKRFSGLVALVLVLQSSTFLIYDTSITYDNYWIMFYLLSLYGVLRSWPVSLSSFILSVFSKPLSVIFIPITLVFVCGATLKRKTKLVLMISYSVILAMGIFAISVFGIFVKITPFDWHDFWMSLGSISYQMRYDGLVLVFLLPVSAALFVVAKRRIRYTMSMIVLMSGAVLSQPILASVTIMSSEPYRFIALVIFFAMSCGVLLSNAKSGESG